MKRSIFTLVTMAVSVVFWSGTGGSSARAANEEEIRNAIQNGLAWLAAQQAPDGCWYGPWGRAAPTGMAVWKFAEWPDEQDPPVDPFDPAYPYHTQLQGGLDCLFGMVQETGGLVWVPGLDTYQTGIAMLAIAETEAPARTVSVPGSPVDGWTYKQVLRGMLDWMEDAQNDGGCEIGGWGYVANDIGWSDNSNSGYATMGIGIATHPLMGFGLTVAPNVLTHLDTFINNVQDPATGASHYNPCWLEGWFNILKQGNLLYEMALVGRPVDDLAVQAALAFIEANWNAGCGSGWQGNYQATFAMSKGLQAYGDALDTLPIVGDWFDQTSTYLVAHQNPDGSWGPGCGEGNWDLVMETTWALLSLEPIPPPARTVVIDIKPGSYPNSINLSNGGVIPVAILTTDQFDATTVDPSTVCFGDAEEPAQRDCTEAHSTGHVEDVDYDGDLDLVLHYETLETGIDPGDTVACLTGWTYGGVPINGCDSVRTR